MPDWSEHLQVLRRDPLRNVVLLKYLLANPQTAVVHQERRGDDVATLLILPIPSVPYDRQTYPELELSATLISTSADLTRRLRDRIPWDRRLLLRLGSDSDRDILAAHARLARRNAFLSFTHTDPPAGTDAEVSADVADAPYDLFAEQGHDEPWLAPRLAEGTALWAAIRESGTAVAACFAFEIDKGLWEIGGVFTRPSHRGRGLARRVVLSALGTLKHRRLVPRYQVAEANIASIGLARSLGMTEFQTLTHFSSGVVA